MPRVIHRNVQTAAAASYDLIVIGGGIHGCSVALEAARMGRRTLLVERGDFGGGTTWNSFRILHGGLRYLQRLDLRRFRESVGERRWFLRHFPDLVEPLPCLLPLYNAGLRRPALFRLAFLVDALLSHRRNRGIRSDRSLPGARLVDPAEVIRLFPVVQRTGLRGGALWHDATIRRPQRLVVEMLCWANRCGAITLNYMEARDLLLTNGRAVGITVVDRATGHPHRFHAPRIINCAGPSSRQVAARFDRDIPRLFQPLLAFNLFLEHPLEAPGAVAVTPPCPGAQTYFLRSWRNGILAGTYYVPWPDRDRPPVPSEESIKAFLADIALAVPDLGIERAAVGRVYAGLLPASAEGSRTPADRDVIHDHGAADGPRGLYSISGVKLTTARLVAEKVLRIAFPGQPMAPAAAPVAVRSIPDLATLHRMFLSEPDAAAAAVESVAAEESVVRFEDFLLRRLDGDLATPAETATAAEIFRLLHDKRTGNTATGSIDHDDAGAGERDRFTKAVGTGGEI